MRANKMPNEMGVSKMHPTNITTNKMPVMVRCTKLLFMITV